MSGCVFGELTARLMRVFKPSLVIFDVGKIRREDAAHDSFSGSAMQHVDC